MNSRLTCQVRRNTTAALSACMPLLALCLPPALAADVSVDPKPLARFTWNTVVNNGQEIPGAGVLFNGYNQPSVNTNGFVVFRGRSKGGTGGEPVHGIFSRDMGAGSGSAVTSVFTNATVVPGPNNPDHQGALSTFTEFPAFPRIGISSSLIATRGQSNPVWTYTLPDGTETRVGTSGVYVLRQGQPLAAASQLGAVPGFEYYAVPGAPAGTRFDQFPGAPALAGAERIVFKGNYTDGVSKTGVFHRGVNPSRPDAAVQLIASSNTLIPGQPADGVRFGSTAPPSASTVDTVFLGLDNEEQPTLGGIYRAPLGSNPALKVLVPLGAQVPGESQGTGFARVGEVLSYDGRLIGFWGSWGAETRPVTLICPQDGNADLIKYCNDTYPSGHLVQVPVHQGFFVHDATTHQTHPVVKTGAEFKDFMYWVFSGRPPGVGDGDSEDFEPPRWRASTFVTSFRLGLNGRAQVAFKGNKPTTPAIDGIYMTWVPTVPQVIRPLVETGSAATLLDPQAPAGSLVSAIGLERDALRGNWLAITASMLNATTGETWAGVYLARTLP